MLIDAPHDARILIVDDQPQNVALLRNLLEQAGYTAVLGLTDSRAALAAYREFQPDLLLLDLLMPHIDGFGVIAQLRPLLPADGFFPILVLTADIAPESKRRALAEGATDFLHKPLDTLEALLRIRILLRTRAQQQQLGLQNAELEHRVRQRTAEVEQARAENLALYRELQRLVAGLLARQAPGNPRRQVNAHLAACAERLTAREAEVLSLLVHGLTNKEIAEQLVVSIATVKFHMEHIIAKLGVADRTQAAIRAIELELP